ncbi:hypothetical protein GW17_00014514 [Ensete ventricosum]|nr:hypothetical protein GW17_00014514 [Ensete ventricosum]
MSTNPRHSIASTVVPSVVAAQPSSSIAAGPLALKHQQRRRYLAAPQLLGAPHDVIASSLAAAAATSNRAPYRCTSLLPPPPLLTPHSVAAATVAPPCHRLLLLPLLPHHLQLAFQHIGDSYADNLVAPKSYHIKLMPLTRQQKKGLNIINLQSYTMNTDDALDAKFKAFEARMEDRFQELLHEIRRNRSESPNKAQHGESSKGSQSEKYDHGQNTGYPRMRVEFPRWEDGNPIGWISCAKKIFRFHRTPEESKVEIT